MIISQLVFFLVFFFCLFFWVFFFAQALGMQKLLGQEWGPPHSSDNMGFPTR